MGKSIVENSLTTGVKPCEYTTLAIGGLTINLVHCVPPIARVAIFTNLPLQVSLQRSLVCLCLLLKGCTYEKYCSLYPRIST
jgi:hypothetical protein